MTPDELFEELSNRTQPNYFPPATLEEITEAERTIGRPLPELLRRLYLVANGGFAGVLGLTRVAMDDEFTVLGLYEGWRDRDEDEDDAAWKWPKAMLPFAYHGCTLFSCVDTETGKVFSFDTSGFVEQNADLDADEEDEEDEDEEGEELSPTTAEEFAEMFVLEADSLEAWFERWL